MWAVVRMRVTVVVVRQLETIPLKDNQTGIVVGTSVALIQKFAFLEPVRILRKALEMSSERRDESASVGRQMR